MADIKYGTIADDGTQFKFLKSINITFKLTSVLLIAITLIGFLAWLGLSPNPESERAISIKRNVIEKIHQAKLEHKTVTIDFDHIANFDWDTLWIFPGYSNYSEIASRIGYRPNPLCYGDVGEFDQLIILMSNGKVVEHIMCTTSDMGSTLEFEDLGDARSFPRDKTKFLVRLDCQQNHWDFYSIKVPE